MKPATIITWCYDRKQIKHLSCSVPNELLNYNLEIDPGHSGDYRSSKCLSTVRKWGSVLASLLSVSQAASLTCNGIFLLSGIFQPWALSRHFPTLLVDSPFIQKMADRLYACAIKLSPLNNEPRLPGGCHVQSPMQQDVMQLPGWREPQLELKPIQQSCKRLSESTAQVPLRRASILHPHIWP